VILSSTAEIPRSERFCSA